MTMFFNIEMTHLLTAYVYVYRVHTNKSDEGAKIRNKCKLHQNNSYVMEKF